MNCFITLWMFDARWLCRLRPMLYEQLILGPLFVNTSLITALVYDCLECDSREQLYAVISLLSFITCVEIRMYLQLTRLRRTVMYGSMTEFTGGCAD